MFLITALPDSHRKIEQFLSAVRRELTGRRTVTVQATWAVMEDEKAAKVLGSAAAAPRPLTPDMQKAMEEDAAYQGSAAALEGQRARLAAGRCMTVLTDVNPVVSENMGAMTPTLQIVQWGPVLEIKADLSEDGRSAGIELDSVLSEPNEASLKALRSTASVLSTTRPFQDYNLVKDVDRLEFVLHTLHSSLRAPTGKPFLVGGMSVAKGPKGKSVYLVLTVNVTP